MDELKLYSVSDQYIEYLRRSYPNVYSNKEITRLHTRKYVGTVIRIADHNYYIPMSSPKDSDFQMVGGNHIIKKSIVPIIRIIIENTDGRRELKGTLRISHMIPVPESELELYNVENERDSAYKDLIQNELIFIRRNQNKIISNARLLYKQKSENDTSAGYIKTALEYKALEELCKAFGDHNPAPASP